MRVRVQLGVLAMVVATPSVPPPTAKVPVVDEYHGVRVVDDYRWLEDWSDPRVQAWSAAQNLHARAVLDGLPGGEAIRARVTALRKAEASRYFAPKWAGISLFALKHQPPKQQNFLVVMSSENAPGAERVLVDPVVLDPQGGTSIDWYVPSRDGLRVAVSLSQGGSERGDLHVFDTATGRAVGEVVPRVNYGTALGSAVFDAEAEGIYYTRYPRPGERPEADLDFFVQVYYHRFGTPTAQDRYEVGRDFPRIAEVFLQSSRDGRYVLADVANGDGGEYAQYLRDPQGRWTALSTFTDRVVRPAFGPGDELYALSRQGAPRGKLVALPLRDAAPGALARAAVRVPEGESVIEGVLPTASRLLLRESVGGPERVRILDRAGKEVGQLPAPAIASFGSLVWLDGRPGETVLYDTEAYADPPAWLRFDLGSGAAPMKVALTQPAPFDLSDVEAVREWATSRDGTRVPLTLLRRKGMPADGKNPTVLTGYGGYGVSVQPFFDPGLRVWFEQGGVWAVANLRGGGEFGEDWHRMGSLTRKQNVFDDFIACAERLVALGVTRPERLAIEGGSNGGLLMGAALTQRPDLVRAVVSHVGIYDMLRVELSPNGAFNVPEFGTVEDPEQFRAMLAYSPYHRVTEGRRYPDVLFLTGANDPRVDPLQSRKMTARLQAVSVGSGKALLRTSAATGHGFGTPLDVRIEQEVDVWAFLFDRLGVAYRTVGVQSP